MSDPLILISEDDRVLTLTLNRASKLNAINREMWGIIRDAVEAFRTRKDLRVLLINAEGNYFSAGVDLTGFDGDYGNSPAEARNWMRRENTAGLQRTLMEMERIEKPIVIAHQGMCIGGALELSLSCHFRLASQSAQYWFPEMKFGMVPLTGGISRLTRLIGQHWANWMVIAQKQVPAEHAFIMGLVHQVYPDADFDDEVRTFCRMLAGNPAEATAVGLMAIDLVADLASDQSRQVELLAYSSLALTPDFLAMHEEIQARMTKQPE
jgi:enoyl-CoA hydratase